MSVEVATIELLLTSSSRNWSPVVNPVGLRDQLLGTWVTDKVRPMPEVGVPTRVRSAKVKINTRRTILRSLFSFLNSTKLIPRDADKGTLV